MFSKLSAALFLSLAIAGVSWAFAKSTSSARGDCCAAGEICCLTQEACCVGVK